MLQADGTAHTSVVSPAHSSLLLFTRNLPVGCSRYSGGSPSFIISHNIASCLPTPLIYLLADLFALILSLPKHAAGPFFDILIEVYEPVPSRTPLTSEADQISTNQCEPRMWRTKRYNSARHAPEGLVALTPVRCILRVPVLLVIVSQA